LDSDAGRADERGARTRPLLVVGAAGQLGGVVVAHLAQRWDTVALSRSDLDLRDATAVSQQVNRLNPWAIVNCAGYNDVDGAEQHAVLAFESNTFAVRTLARAAAACDAVLIHFSSDFVFDGASDRPYREDDVPRPLSVYAASKLLGEWFAVDVPRHYILRVESLFGGLARRKSSLDRIIDAVATDAPVRVFTDRVVSPSFVWDIAAATAGLLERHVTPGLYHCVNSGAATWMDVAVEVRRVLGSSSPLEPITLADVQLRAPRPRYCALSNDKLRDAGITMPTWQDAVARAITERNVTG
jgi:dTDP-4-dehydrorhamnose reductase